MIQINPATMKRAGNGKAILFITNANSPFWDAVEAGMTVPRGLELGPFSYFPGFTDDQAHARHVVNEALLRECSRYQLNYDRVLRAYAGEGRAGSGEGKQRRGWLDWVVVGAAVGVFVFLGVNARAPALGMEMGWLWALTGVAVATALACGFALWKATRFS